MTSTNRPPFSDSFLGRVRYNYQVSFEGPNKNAPLNPLARLYSIVSVRQALAKELPLGKTLAMVPLYIVFDILRVLWLILSGAMYRYLRPRLGKLQISPSFDPAFYKDHPPKPVIHPNRAYSGGAEVGISDGEHLWIDNEVSVGKVVASFCILTVLAPGLIFIEGAPLFALREHVFTFAGGLIAAAWIVFSIYIFVFVLVPSRTGIMFHRRAQTATFYRGWLRRPVTVPYNQVTYTSGVDPSGGGGWLVIRAKVPDTFAIFGWAKLSTAVSDGMAQTAGAIDVFMDQGNDFAMPIRIKESIEWHREDNTTLWRYAGQEPPAEFAEHYKQPDSLYNKELCDPFSSVYDKAVFAATRMAARQELVQKQKTEAFLAEHDAKRDQLVGDSDILRDYCLSILDQRPAKHSEDEFLEIYQTHQQVLNMEVLYQLSPFLLAIRASLRDLREAEADQKKVDEYFKLSRAIPSGDCRYMYLVALFPFFEALKTAYQSELLDYQFIFDHLKKLTESEPHDSVILKGYDWAGLRDRAVAYILYNRDDLCA